jgi:predicted ABC-type ATPase
MTDDVAKANAQTEFMNDCVPYFIDEGKDQDQAVAICLHLWEGKRWRLARARAEQLQVRRRHAENKARFAALRYQPHPWRALRQRAEQLLVRFDPDQPRDEDGKWADGGGGGGGSSGSSGTGTSHEHGDFVREWAESGNWQDYQHAARAVINGESVDDYVCYDCSGDDAERYAAAEEVLDSINAQSALKEPLYRGLTRGAYKVGDRFSESLSSWTTKKDLAENFASGAYTDRKPSSPGQVLTLDIAKSVNSKGLNVSDYLSADASDELRNAGEYLTTGEYEVTAVNGRDVTVRRVGAARGQNLKLAFDPDQPRDEDGKWTDGGGGGGGGSGGGGAKPASETKPVVPSHANPKVKEVIDKVPGAQAAIDRAVAKLDAPGSKPSDAPVGEGGYKRSDGLYSAPRQKVHAEILEKIFTPEKIAAATPKPGEQPTAHLLGGSGGSGKGWFTKPEGTVRTDNAIYLNSDDMKAMLPEYQGWNAPLLHEESSELLKLTENMAMAQGLNVIIDGTMSKYDGLAKRIDRFKDGGYRVEGHFMRVTPETSATRALQRFVRGGETGRYVPPEMLLAHPATSNFEKARSKMDAWEMYDNEGTKPKFVSRG